MTNFEKIKNMTEEELARFLCDLQNHCESCSYRNNSEECELVIEPTMYWLSNPVNI